MKLLWSGRPWACFRDDEGQLRFHLVFNSVVFAALPNVERLEDQWKLQWEGSNPFDQQLFYTIPHEIGHCLDAIYRDKEYDGKSFYENGFEVQKHLDFAAGSIIEEFGAAFFSAPFVGPGVFMWQTEFAGELLIKQLKSLKVLTERWTSAQRGDLRDIALGAIEMGFRFLYSTAITVGMRTGNEKLKECPLFYWDSEKKLLGEILDQITDAFVSAKDGDKLAVHQSYLAELMEEFVYSLGYKFVRAGSGTGGDGVYWDASVQSLAIEEVENALITFREIHNLSLTEEERS